MRQVVARDAVTGGLKQQLGISGEAQEEGCDGVAGAAGLKT
jgi:hypothetical protein